MLFDGEIDPPQLDSTDGTNDWDNKSIGHFGQFGHFGHPH